jgi:hypothetical protein
MLTAILALAGLITIGSGSGRALAADAYNQMTGSGLTASALTVNWASGLLDAQNQPLTTSARTDGGTELAPNSARTAGTGQLSFMYPDFQNIQVEVSQTDNISHQGITVTWKGAMPTNGGAVPRTDFMQIMECWGDASSGPSPDDCQFGSAGMLGSGVNAAIGQRDGYLCKPGEVISTTTPPKGYGNNAAYGCDVNEPTGEIPSHCNPKVVQGDNCAAPDGFYEIPFVGVDDGKALYGQENLLTDFSSLNSNEVQDGVTNPDGTGQVQFETLTSIEAPHLGCGALEDTGQPDAGQARGCWLVIVPRGNFEPNGYVPSGFTVPGGYLNTSPLSASNWAQRIQIHLDYAPLGTACPPTVLPEPAVGTQLISRAVSSWELALNQAADCKTVYAFTATTENSATTAIEGTGPSHSGIAFTTIPVGGEATRYTGGAPPSLPNMLYAPVAVTAMDLGFNINEGVGYVNTPVKLTPQVLARTLTQAYRSDLPDYVAGDLTHPGPAWAQGNPLNMTEDPAFQTLNPPSEITTVDTALSLAPLLPEDHSSLNQQVWQWVQSDAATGTWLDATSTSADAVQVDPDYEKLSPQLGAAPAPDSFPRAYSGVLDLGQCTPAQGCTTPKEEKLLSIDMLPYPADIGTAAAQVLAGNDTALRNQWDPVATASDSSLGWWDKWGILPAGTTFMSALSDLPDVASYGLVAAALCNPAGATCVAPSIDSVTTTLNAATPDSSGLLEINPSTVPAGGYPLVQVVYAAVPTNESAQALTDYATLIQYAANQGQVPGSNPGDLPPGYLPLTDALKAQANSVVQQLQQLASPTPTASTTGTTSPTESATQQATTSGTTTSGTTTGGTTTGGTTTGGTTAGGTTTGGTTTGGTTTGGTTGGTTTGGTTGTGSGTSGPASTASAHPTGSGSAAASTSPAVGGPSISPPSAQLAAGTTPATAVGAIRRTLIIVLIIGAAGAVGGALLRVRGLPMPGRTRRRRVGP